MKVWPQMNTDETQMARIEWATDDREHVEIRQGKEIAVARWVDVRTRFFASLRMTVGGFAHDATAGREAVGSRYGEPWATRWSPLQQRCGNAAGARFLAALGMTMRGDDS